MTRKFTVLFSVGAAFVIAFFAGHQVVSINSHHLNVSAVASQTSSPKMRDGIWQVNKDGDTSTTLDLTFTGSRITGRARVKGNEKAEGAIEGRIYYNEGSRSHSLITLGVQELQEQYSGKGRGCAVYAGVWDGRKVIGTYYENDGGKPIEFELTR